MAAETVNEVLRRLGAGGRRLEVEARDRAFFTSPLLRERSRALAAGEGVTGTRNALSVVGRVFNPTMLVGIDSDLPGRRECRSSREH
jgi:hypothetical protein